MSGESKCLMNAYWNLIHSLVNTYFHIHRIESYNWKGLYVPSTKTSVFLLIINGLRGGENENLLTHRTENPVLG